MRTRPVTSGRVSKRLCAQAADLHKAITALPDRYSNHDRLALTNQLVGIRSALSQLYGAEPNAAVPSSNPATAVLTDWWRHRRPSDWVDHGTVLRHREQLYVWMHELVLAYGTDSIPGLAHKLGINQSTLYFVLANPGRSRWRTVEPVVLGLGGHRDEMWTMWQRAYTPPKKTIPPPRIGRGLTPRRT